MDKKALQEIDKAERESCPDCTPETLCDSCDTIKTLAELDALPDPKVGEDPEGGGSIRG